MALAMLPENIKQLKLNSRVLIETVNEVILGTVTDLHRDYLYIELKDALELVTDYIYANEQIVCLSKVIRILILDKHKATEQINLIKERVKLRTRLGIQQNCSVLITPNSLDTHCISACEWRCVDWQMCNIVVIKQTDQKYHNACSDIKARTAITLQLEPWQGGRNQSLAIIIITTNTHIYIFDMLALGGVLKDLRNILSAALPRKIVFRSNFLCDMLEHRYNTRLDGVFDVYAAYCHVMRTKKIYQFHEVAEKFLQLPLSYFDLNDSFDCYARPFEQRNLQMLAKAGLTLGIMHKKLLYERMLREYTLDGAE